MANYKEIKGFHVQSLSSDPIANQFAGGTWASSTAANTARRGAAASTGGTTTAALVFGGYIGPPVQAITEKYNGTAWTEVNDLNTARYFLAGAGTQTAALGFAGTTGSASATTEKFDGTNWTEVNDLNTARAGLAGFGTQTAALATGGEHPPTAVTESFDGTNWTEVNDLNTARHGIGGVGTTTAGLAFGGNPPGTGATESWNGTSWTEVSDLNTARYWTQGAGIQTSALCFGGEIPPPASTAVTEYFNGSSWTEVGDLGTASSQATGQGTSSAALKALGNPGSSPYLNNIVEIWDAPSTFSQQNLGQVYYNSSSTNAFKVTETSVPGGTWASGANMNEPRNNLIGQGAGNKTAALVWGGKQAPPTQITKNESYDGSSWTEVGDLNAGRTNSGGAGTQTAALAIGNTSSSGITESWNGTSWTEVNDLNTGRNYAMWSGIQTSALAGAGYTTTMVNNTETWNGTSWTEASEVNEARDGVACAGDSNTSGLIAGGYHTTSPPTNTQNTEIWNGSSWTEVNNLNGKTRAGTGGGTTTAAFCAGGQNDPPSGPPWQVTTANTEYFNGTSWTELNDLSSAVNEQAGRGGTTAAFSAGGSPSPTGLNTVEVWTAALENKTITVS